MNDELSEWQALGAKPIRADAPAGDSIQYDSDFERLSAQINKLEGLSGQPVDWKEVVQLAQTILIGKSKDLRVAAYLCYGLLEEKRYTGLLNGLSCLAGMTTSFWESLYPEAKRMRGRISAMIWLSEKVSAAVTRKPPQAGEKETISASVQQIESLEKFLDEKLGNSSPTLGEIRRALQEHLQHAEPVALEVTETKSQEASPSAAPMQQISDITTMDQAERVLQETKDTIQRVSSFMRQQDPCNPWPYRIDRFLIWLEVDDLPPNTDGKTRIQSPADRLIQLYTSLVQQEEWVQLLNQVESQIQEYPFWIDLHRFSAQALTHLGPAYEKAKAAVCAEVQTLLQRLPGLLDMTFSNGLPFSDVETRKWVEREVAPSEKSGLSSLPSITPTQNEQDDVLLDLRNKAQSHLAEGQLKEGIRLFQQAIAMTSSQREKFLIRLELAKLCMEEGHLKMAISQLQILDHEIVRFSLEEWEPRLSLEVLQRLLHSLNQLLQDTRQALPGIADDANEIYRRLCRLDMTAALDLEDKKKSKWFGR